jgi:hypothetical protein
MKMTENGHDHEDESIQAPADLVSALRRLPREPLFVPPTVDEAILRAARRQLSPPESPRVVWLRWVPWLAAAAAAALLLVRIPGFHRTSIPVRLRVGIEDLNHDGRVDILDAFALARQLKSGASPDRHLDINGDGVVDERDVAAIAAQAVKLEKGGRS